jgi:hypothetical protein
VREPVLSRPVGWRRAAGNPKGEVPGSLTPPGAVRDSARSDEPDAQLPTAAAGRAAAASAAPHRPHRDHDGEGPAASSSGRGEPVLDSSDLVGGGALALALATLGYGATVGQWVTVEEAQLHAFVRTPLGTFVVGCIASFFAGAHTHAARGDRPW